MNFWFHYNKPLSKKKGKPIVSVHCNRKCYFVEGNKLIVGVPTVGVVKKQQPFFVMAGKANQFVEIEDKIIIS